MPSRRGTPAAPTVSPMSPSAASSAVLISEIAWSGTAASAEDEWIELFNRTSHPIDLSNWRLRASDGEPDIRLASTIPARGFYLLERGDDTTISNIRADQIYTSALSDRGEKLFLYDPFLNVIDRANGFSNRWVAGELSRPCSMERSNFSDDNSTSWAANNGTVRNGRDASGYLINGTPGRRNSVFLATLTPPYTLPSTLTPTSTPDPDASVNMPTTTLEPSTTPTLTPPPPTSLPPTTLHPGCSGAPGDANRPSMLDPALLPDLTASYLRISLEHPGCLRPGDGYGLVVVIQNLGPGRAGSFVVSMDHEDLVVAGVKPHSGVSLFFQHFTYPYACVMVDSTGAVEESDETNNLVSQQLAIPTAPRPCTTSSTTTPSPQP